MDPDAIFILLLFVIMLALTMTSIIGLSKKIWRSKLFVPTKALLIGLLLIFLTFSILKFNSVDTGNVVISTVELIMLIASFLIGLNWSINLISKGSFKRIKIPVYFKVIILTVIFAVLIPSIFYLAANFFDKLNLMGSGG